MKKTILFAVALGIALSLSACETEQPDNTPATPVTEQPVENDNNNTNEENNMITRMRITVNGHTLYATLEDNATTRAIAERLPMTLPMMDLYGREMCYRFPDALPTDNARTRGYEVGEIVYYPPMHSFVIMYRQNGEHFQMQSIGRIDSGVELFDGIGDVEVRFESAE